MNSVDQDRWVISLIGGHCFISSAVLNPRNSVRTIGDKKDGLRSVDVDAFTTSTTCCDLDLLTFRI